LRPSRRRGFSHRIDEVIALAADEVLKKNGLL
jgi:hypothetical protein